MSDFTVSAILKAVDSGFSSGLDAAARKAESLETAVTKAGNKMSSVGSTLTAAVTAPLLAVGTGAVKAASDFESSMAKVATIADTSAVPLEDLGDAVISLSNKTGKSSGEIAEALYQAISAGQSTEDAMNFVEKASQLAVGGFTDMTTATDTLTTALNAYGMNASEVTDVSNKLITAQNLGKTSVGELGSSMGKVIPTAAMYGVSLDQLASAYVTTTKNGIATAESGTYINGMLNELGKSGTTASNILKEKTGKSFQELMADGYSLTDVIGILNDKAVESGGTIADMFGSQEAGKAAATLIQHTDDFTEAIEAMGTSAGSTEDAFNTMSATTAVELDKLKQSAVNSLGEIGTSLLPVLVPLLQTVSDKVQQLSTWWSNLDTEQQNTILTIAGIAAAAGPALVIAGKAISIIGGLAGTIGTLTAASTASTPAVSAGGGALAKLSANAGGLLALGAAVLMVGGGLALMAVGSRTVADGGGAAIATFFGMVAAGAALAGVMALLGPTLTAGAAGMLAFGAALLMAGAGAALAGAGIALIGVGVKPIASYGPAAATGIAAIATSMLLLAPSSTTAAASVGLFDAAAVAGAVSAAALAVALVGVTAEMVSIASNSKTASTNIKDIQSATSVVSSALEGMGRTAQNAVKAFTSAFQSAQSTAKSSATTMMNGFNSGIQSGVTRAVASARAGSMSAGSAFTAGVGVARNSGVMMSAGFAQGMESQLGRIQAAAARMVSAANQAVIAKAQIGSPSRLMRKDGSWTGEGYVLGILDWVKEAYNAGAELVSAPSRAISDGLSTEYSYASNQSIIVDVPLYIDGEELARAQSDNVARAQARYNRNSMRLAGAR